MRAAEPQNRASRTSGFGCVHTGSGTIGTPVVLVLRRSSLAGWRPSSISSMTAWWPPGPQRTVLIQWPLTPGDGSRLPSVGQLPALAQLIASVHPGLVLVAVARAAGPDVHRPLGAGHLHEAAILALAAPVGLDRLGLRDDVAVHQQHAHALDHGGSDVGRPGAHGAGLGRRAPRDVAVASGAAR